MRSAAAVVRWFATRVVGPAVVALAWCTYVFLSGRPWRHGIRRRLVTRPVRAAGNWLVTAAVAALVWKPVSTAVVLVLAGGALVGTAVATRRRSQLTESGQSPIRVAATVGSPQRDPGGR